MLALVLALLGAALGWYRAGKLGGNRLDRLQYAAVFGIIGLLLGLAVSIAIGWQIGGPVTQ